MNLVRGAHVGIPVSDLDASIAFCTATLERALTVFLTSLPADPDR
ncbi:VOC family protein [Streptomyces sp. NPDC003863]